MQTRLRPGALAVMLAPSACGEVANLHVEADTGPQPALPAPVKPRLPTLSIAPAQGWSAGTMPRAAPGMNVGAFARGPDHPRWLHVLPKGDVQVAEANALPRPGDAVGIKDWVAGMAMKRASAGVPSANCITLMRDNDGDGVADLRKVLLEGLNSPFGRALVGDGLYVATSDAVLRLRCGNGDTRIASPGGRVADLLAGAIDHHSLTAMRGGAFYSVPYTYFGTHVDARAAPPRHDAVAAAVTPDYALGPHAASLPLASAAGNALPARFANGMFVGQNGFWNRRSHTGYKVVFVAFERGWPAAAAPLDVLTGFRSDAGNARGRAVGVAIDRQGALPVADDVGNAVWRVTALR